MNLNGDFDGTAKASGLITTFCLLALNAVNWTQVLTTIIAGIFGLMSALGVTLLNYYLRERKARRRKKEDL